MNIEHLQGLIAAPFTPMHPDGSLNLAIIPAYYNLLKTNGNTGAFICGSTGEGVSMTLEEKKRVAEAWAEASKGDADFKVITLVGGTCLQDAVALARHAQSINLHAAAFTAPFYFKPASVQALAACCKVVADAAPELPFYYYHIPVLTGVNFQMFDLLQAVDGLIPNFAGIKYTHEDFMDYLSCLQFSSGKYDMLWGRDENLLSALVLGAKGGVGSTYNYAAPLYTALIEAYNQGDHGKARRLQQQSIDMIRLLGKYGGIATGKAYMKVIGLDCGEFRLPVRNMGAEQFRLFAEDVAALDFNAFCSRRGNLIHT
ncbi:dihydrodipicolinate synthase family protein [Pontibacter sp. 172403-2]|uniref:dihydrodipicolinate synthase family protein n=1 Tax=Pontibacter rufus TaxID=2791028 RepID=UPI0018AF6BA8|nr:dihydrodipicolinate synthase family protein [Pontibacter sp. 172403-2]MBF9252700.1 dihydrodipicolinate synthase family protein [Pontibacter sp. 172403-2]